MRIKLLIYMKIIHHKFIKKNYLKTSKIVKFIKIKYNRK